MLFFSSLIQKNAKLPATMFKVDIFPAKLRQNEAENVNLSNRQEKTVHLLSMIHLSFTLKFYRLAIQMWLGQLDIDGTPSHFKNSKVWNSRNNNVICMSIKWFQFSFGYISLLDTHKMFQMNTHETHLTVFLFSQGSFLTPIA